MYVAPLSDFSFILRHVIDGATVLSDASGGQMSPGDVDQVLEHAADLAATLLEPLNAVGDREGAQFDKGAVAAASGFKEALHEFTAGGWLGLGLPERVGGQGLPHVVSNAAEEMWNAANMAFALCPGLTASAIKALDFAASEELKARFLLPMVEGRWSGTMNLTEPQAGTDLGAIRTRAEPQNDGTYRLTGQKIFITWGEHDMVENIIHLVLARLPDAPQGPRGLSLFLVPKFLVNADGTLGARNEVECLSIEHKMGIKGSPTCVLQYGGQNGAIGYLVGAPNRGLESMFVMMNSARMGVGVQALGVADRAYQKAAVYARERVQGRPPGEPSVSHTIDGHPDVRRMLLSMKTLIGAMRAFSLQIGAWSDLATHAADEGRRGGYQARVEFCLPVFKGWLSENAQAITYDAVQVHGGMGFIEETGVARHCRDARILTIYEGTTAIQANDLIGRKLAVDNGATARILEDQIAGSIVSLRARYPDAMAMVMAHRLETALHALQRATTHMLEVLPERPRDAYAGAVPYLQLWGIVLGGWLHARMFLAAHDLAGADNDPALKARIADSEFYARYHLPHAVALSSVIEATADIS
jgi:3-(methylthio)propanoyl-CoA dehydrogenase